MIKIKYIILLILFFFNCKEKELKEKTDIKTDTLVVEKVELKKDSIEVPKKEINDCFGSNIDLEIPIDYNLNLLNYEFKNLNCEIKNSEGFLCDQPFLRYIQLSKINDIHLVIVPIDCGDFSNRFYLLTIKENQLISNLYISGEWFEPENDTFKELTTFKISKDYQIFVKTTTIENDKKDLVEEKKYQINPDGKMVEN